MNFQHIKNLWRAYFLENGKRDLWFFLLAAVISYFAPAIIKISLLIFLCIFTEKVLEPLLKKNRTLHYLMIPANYQEKATALLFLYNLYFIPGLVLSFFIGWGLGHYTLQRTILLAPSGFPSMWPYLYYIYLFASTAFFGYIYFRKNAALKILGCYILTIFLMLAIPILVAICYQIPMNAISIAFPMQHLLKYVALAYMAFFYFLSYLRLKETEV